MASHREGSEVLVRYNVAGPGLYHERLILAHIADWRYVICTPDLDIYDEDFGGPDFHSIRKFADGRTLPPGIVPAQVYGLELRSALARSLTCLRRARLRGSAFLALVEPRLRALPPLRLLRLRWRLPLPLLGSPPWLLGR